MHAGLFSSVGLTYVTKALFDKYIAIFLFIPNTRGGTSYEKVGGQKMSGAKCPKIFCSCPPTIPVCPPPHFLGGTCLFCPHLLGAHAFVVTINQQCCLILVNELINGASAYGTPLDGATVKVVITTVNKT